MNYSGKIFTAAAALVLCCSNIFAQEQNPQDTTAAPKPAISENAPMFRSEGEPRLYHIRDVNVHGVQYLNPEILKSSAGLIAGDSVYLPSNFISNAISRLWSQRFFSDVKIGAEIEGDSLDLEVFLKERPRVYNWEFEGISKGKKKDLLEKLKLKRGSELSDYVIDKNKKLIHNYWAEKGFRTGGGGSSSGVIPTATESANKNASNQSPFVSPLARNTTGTKTVINRINTHAIELAPRSNPCLRASTDGVRPP